jgi:hypothetical protein
MRLAPISLIGTALFASSLANAETVVEYEDRHYRRADWNLIAGGVAHGDTLQGEVGYSMAYGAYHHALGDSATIGALLGLDYGLWHPDDEVLGGAVVLGMPLKFSLYEGPKHGFSLDAMPALYLGFDQPGRADEFIPGLWLEVGFSGAAKLNHGFVIGGGIDVPILIGFPTEYRDTFVAVPILVGPMFEWHFTNELALTAELKFGPHFMTDGYGTDFGARFLVGIAYNL